MKVHKLPFLIMFFWIKSPCGLFGKEDVSEKCAVSIFRAEVMSRETNVPKS
jgi:hypothetical protein